MANRRKPPKMSAEAIRELTGRLKTQDSTLQESYDKILKALGLECENPAYTFYKEKRERQRHWWERSDSAHDDFTVNVNLLHQVIEAQRAPLGIERCVRVPRRHVDWASEQETVQAIPGPEPVSGRDEEYGTEDEYCDRLEKLIYYLWHVWMMSRRWLLIGWYETIFGAAIGVLHFSPERNLPMFSVRSPQGFYGVPSMDDETVLDVAVFVRQVSGMTAAQALPQYAAELSDRKSVEVIDYYDRYQRTRLVADYEEPAIDTPNPVGKVPVFVFPGIVAPGYLGLSAMQLAIPIHNEIERLYSLEAEVLVQSVRAPTVINDPVSVPANFKWGDDATIEVGASGNVSKARLDSVDHNLFFHRINDMKANLDNVVDFSAIARGQFGGSIVTGKGVTALLSPMEQRMASRLQGMNGIMERVNECALLMLHKLGKKTTLAYGRAGNSVFSTEFDPRKHIDPAHVRNIVFADTSSSFDRQANLTGMLTALRTSNPAQQGISRRRFIELSPWTDDAAKMAREIDKEWLEAQNMAASVASQGGMPAGPGPTAPTAEEQLYAAERGGSLEGAPAPGAAAGGEVPQAPTFGGELEAEAAPETADLAIPGLLDALAEHFRSIARIKGKVYLLGEVLNDVLAFGVEVYCTDPLDRQTIVNSFSGDPELRQITDSRSLHFKETEPEPDENVLEVTPGTDQETPAPWAQVSGQGEAPASPGGPVAPLQPALPPLPEETGEEVT